ncbi:MAG: hypothetical protein MUO72_17130, partial [Bacteroidales bacterium]|nr:hypothetical protein [Bacteroidales bacterium]
ILFRGDVIYLVKSFSYQERFLDIPGGKLNIPSAGEVSATIIEFCFFERVHVFSGLKLFEIKFGAEPKTKFSSV